MRKYHLGDDVKWVSQSGGYYKTKEGVIVAIVAPEQDPFDVAKLYNLGRPRNHESYVVRVGKKLYWPRVSALSMPLP